MLCPVCKVDLLLSEKQGIEIDYCPKCRGIWLDRGELDKIVEKSANVEDNFRQEERNTNTNNRDDDKFRSQGYNKNKRKSFLGDLFDF
ncbi:MAG: zf-TFIIB domain-containing protein [Melioribacteraceae bacterium]